MFIQTEETPNPQALKFLPGRLVLPEDFGDFSASYTNVEECENSPFARQLLEINGVAGVFFGSDFITITKNTDFDWYLLKPLILGKIMELFINNLPVIISADKTNRPETLEISDEDPLVKQIRELLDTRIRPAVAQDGGDITFHSFVDGVVYLKMQGSCSSCPSSTITLKSGIENMLRYYVPEVLEVKQIEN